VDYPLTKKIAAFPPAARTDVQIELSLLRIEKQSLYTLLLFQTQSESSEDCLCSKRQHGYEYLPSTSLILSTQASLSLFFFQFLYISKGRLTLPVGLIN
jgi:hypothetical protein